MSTASSRLLLTVTFALLLGTVVAQLVRAGPGTAQDPGAAMVIQGTATSASPINTPVSSESPVLTETSDVTPTSTVTVTQALTEATATTDTPTPVPPTPTSTAADSPVETPAPAPSETMESTPEPSDVSTETPIPEATPMPGPIPAPLRTMFEDLTRWASENQLLAGAGCLVPLFVLGVLLIISAVRRGSLRRAPPAPPAPSGPHLEAMDAPNAPRHFELKPAGVTIGRAPDNDLTITEDFQAWETVSSHHARIYRQGGYWVVEDLGSMNGVTVNGTRTGRNVLQDGWQMGIGGAAFIFHAGTGESP